ncbi:MAG: hypothetical protein M3M94_00240, partial [Actinomycetota bacterium]|nr:hypothetical protein [Actinomycetota bacterium]
RRPLGPPTRLTPLLRLVALVAVAILAVVLLVFWIQSCQGASKTRAYRDYVKDVRGVASQSANVGRQLDRLLTTPGIRQPQLRARLNGLTQQENINLARAAELSPPGPLREAHQRVIQALQFRLSGLNGLKNAFARTATVRDPERAGSLLANQASRFVASDVVWDDGFKDPAKTVLRRQEIGGVRVPDSNFVRNPDLVTARSLATVWRGLRGAATGGTPTGLRGTSLESVRVLPAGQVLSATTENVIRATADLAFEVSVLDSGNAQEVGVPVTLTIERREGGPIVRTKTIDVIAPNQTKTVVFRDIGQPEFGEPRTMRVAVKPVRGEARPENNSATYTVIFSFGR